MTTTGEYLDSIREVMKRLADEPPEARDYHGPESDADFSWEANAYEALRQADTALWDAVRYIEQRQ